LRYNGTMNKANIKNALEHISDLPTPIARWDIDTGTDSLGEDAVWVWAIVDDARLEALPQPVRIRMRDKIRSAINNMPSCTDLMVYIRFRATSEA
jgi:hypothetical protein